MISPCTLAARFRSGTSAPWWVWLVCVGHTSPGGQDEGVVGTGGAVGHAPACCIPAHPIPSALPCPSLMEVFRQVFHLQGTAYLLPRLCGCGWKSRDSCAFTRFSNIQLRLVQDLGRSDLEVSSGDCPWFLRLWLQWQTETTSLFHIWAGQHRGSTFAASGAPEPQDQPSFSWLWRYGCSIASLQVQAESIWSAYHKESLSVKRRYLSWDSPSTPSPKATQRRRWAVTHPHTTDELLRVLLRSHPSLWAVYSALWEWAVGHVGRDLQQWWELSHWQSLTVHQSAEEVQKALGGSSCLCNYPHSFYLWAIGSCKSLARVFAAVQENAAAVHSVHSGWPH